MNNKKLIGTYAYDVDYDFNKHKTIVSRYQFVWNEEKKRIEPEYERILCEKEDASTFISLLRHDERYRYKSLNEYGYHYPNVYLINLLSAKLRLSCFKNRTKIVAHKYNEVLINNVLYFDTYIYYIDTVTGHLYAYRVSRNIYSEMLNEYIHANYTRIDSQELKNIESPFIRIRKKKEKI